MKKVYFSFLSLFVTVFASAQLTQGNNAPLSGETYSMFQCDNVAAGPGGSATTFSYVVNTQTVLNAYTVAATSSTTYPQANVGVAFNSSNTAYYSSSASSLLYYGGNVATGQVMASLNYSAPAIHAAYPMSYNTTTNTAIGGSINVISPLPASGTFAGTNTTTCDGSGTLTVAGMTFTNVLRVNITEVISFSTNLGNGTLDKETIRYFQIGIKQPIMSIETVSANTALGASSQTLVQHINATPTNTLGSDVGIATFAPAQQAISVFPNPASNDVTVIVTNPAAAIIRVTDVTGKQVSASNIKSVKSTISVTDLQNGLYIYSVEDQGGNTLHTGKITVVH